MLSFTLTDCHERIVSQYITNQRGATATEENGEPISFRYPNFGFLHILESQEDAFHTYMGEQLLHFPRR